MKSKISTTKFLTVKEIKDFKLFQIVVEKSFNLDKNYKFSGTNTSLEVCGLGLAIKLPPFLSLLL